MNFGKFVYKTITYPQKYPFAKAEGIFYVQKMLKCNQTFCGNAGRKNMIDNYKGVIFDFNGTLFFDSEKHVLAWGKMGKELRGSEIGLEEMQAHFYDVPNNRAIEYLLQKECDEAELTKYSELKEAYYRDFCREDKETFHLVAGCHEFFDKLVEEKVPFTIASASIKPNIDFFVESFELAKWFDPEKIVYDDGSFENKVKMFLYAANVIGVPIEELEG